MEQENNNTQEKMSPSVYFDYLKNAKNDITTDALKNSYEVFVKLAEKYNKLGQTESLKKLCFLADTLAKEEKLIEMGITTYIYKDVIMDFIDKVADEAVKIIELEHYTREIPDELIPTIEKTKPVFDKFYIIFTDYTGKEQRRVEKERRDKDPILFGVFKKDNNVADRFYFLGDWVDEYCDLTLDKMIDVYKEKREDKSPVREIKIPATSEELLDILKSYVPDPQKQQASPFNYVDAKMDLPATKYVQEAEGNPKKSFFEKVCSVFSGK